MLANAAHVLPTFLLPHTLTHTHKDEYMSTEYQHQHHQIKLHGVPGSHFMMSRCCKQHWMMYISRRQDTHYWRHCPYYTKQLHDCMHKDKLPDGKNTEQKKTDQQVTMKSNWICCTEQACNSTTYHMLHDSLQACSTAVVSIVQAPNVSTPHSLTAMMTMFSMT